MSDDWITDADVTDAARTIAREANSWIGSGQSGYLVFNRDGSGGQWYSLETSRHALERLENPGVVVLRVPQLWRDGYSPHAIQAALFDGEEG
jgi:hypothetical protein